jgi:acyl-CoA hydrolase
LTDVREIAAKDLDLTAFVRPGDRVLWGHGTSEPLTLTEALMRQRAAIGRFSAFIGVTFSQTPRPEHADVIAFESYCGLGANQALHAAQGLDILPVHLSALPELMASGRLRADVVLMQLSAPDESGRFSPGVSHDYLLDAARRARVVIAEVNAAAPWTFSDADLASLRIDAVVRTSRPVLEVATPPASPVDEAIAGHVAGLVADRAVLQLGIGSLPGAILSRLSHHKDLGLHSGLVGDGLVDLVEAGVMTNADKNRDRGVAITGMLAGTERLYRYAHRQPAVQLRPVRYTHGAEVLASIDRLHAINSALEVDLTGQVNAELLNGRYVGAIGGQVDFVRGAQRSRGGKAITALPATAARGTVSRIVPRISEATVTTARSDADLFVTEWGVADLRGQPLAERARRMVRIAHPDHRETLERAAHAFQRKH